VVLSHVGNFFHAGGVSDVNDPREQKEIIKLLSDHICTLGGCWTIGKITKITQQVVAGMLYQVTGVFNKVDDGKQFEMTISIYSRPWENVVELAIVDKRSV
jgi:hypothetical protein